MGIYYAQQQLSAQLPRIDVSPEVKAGRDWNINTANYIYQTFLNSWFYTKQQRFEWLRRYARGEQDTDYRSYFFDENTSDTTLPTGATQQNAYAIVDDQNNGKQIVSTQDKRLSLLNINFDQLFSPMDTIMKTLEGIFDSQEHEIKVFSIDTKSNEYKKSLKFKQRLQIEYAELLSEINNFLGIKEQDPTKPKTIEELEIYDKIGGFMLPYEVALQEVIKYTFEKESDLKDLKRRIIRDLISINYASMMEVVDKVSQRIYLEYIDPADLILQYSDDDRRFKDIGFWGKQKFYTIQDIRSMTGWDEERIYNLAVMFNGNQTLGNSKITTLTELNIFRSTNQANYNDFRIPVLYYEYKTVDSEYFTNVTGQDGKTFVVDEPYRKNGYKKPKEYNKDNRKTDKTDIVTWYCGNWIMGTNEIFDYGKKFDQPFDIRDKESRCSLHFYAMSGSKSLVEQAIPLLDNMEMLYLKYQQDIATSPPTNSMAIEITSLNNLTLGNQKVKPLDAIKMFSQTGKFLYAIKPAVIPGQSPEFNNVKPFETIIGGLEPAIKSFAMGINIAYEQLSVMTGLDRITLNSSSGQDQSATSIRSAISATRDSLKPIYNGYISILERIAYNTALLGQQLIVDNDDESVGYYGIISDAKIQALKEAGKTPPAEYGILCQARPTQEEIEELRQFAYGATAGGKNGIPALTASEAMFIMEQARNGTPLQDIRLYIAYKERQRDEQEKAFALQSQKVNKDGEVMADNAKTQNAKDLKKFETDQEIRLEYAKAMFKTMVESKKGENKIMDTLAKLGVDISTMIAENKMQQGNIQNMVGQSIQEEVPQNQEIPTNQEQQQEQIPETEMSEGNITEPVA